MLVLFPLLWHVEMMRYLLALTLVIFCAAAGQAVAQDAVGVRIGQHDDYSRVVFDWGASTPYKTDQSDPSKLVVTFEKNAKLQSVPAASGNVLGLQVISEAPLQVSIAIPPGSKTRALTAGDRVVIDVYNAPNAPPAEKPAEKPPEKVAEKVIEKKPEPVSEAPPEIADKIQPEKAEPVLAEVKPATEAPATETPKTETPATETFGPTPPDAKLFEPKTGHAASAVVSNSSPGETPKTTKPSSKSSKKPTLVTVSSTEAHGMSVFQLNGDIWMVTDLGTDPLMNPQVSGPQSAEVKPVENIKMFGGKAYRVNMIEGKDLRTQGGGMLWHVVLAADMRRKNSLRPIREGVDDKAIRSGKIIWPFMGARKILDVTDPTSGAKIKVVTVQSAKQYSGPAMDFVDFRTLQTVAGIAIIPKVDDLEVKITEKGVEVSRPGGLALTSEDMILSAMTAIQRKKSQPEDSKSPKVFEFKNWQLGGVEALAQNNSIIMAGLSNLSESGKLEGIMTLAKMYISNAQGSEALGFLDFIEDKLPAMADNAQFIALRGAAKALDWRSEDAFSDFGLEALDPFEEIGYWKAFVLADLGDWIQAADVMPDNLNTFFDYPEAIFNRMAPVLAEVALRSGNVKQADEILEVLGDNTETMFLSQKSALEYLKGESSRQRGKTAETKSLWEPLTRGKDDLYRVKAGLALTRLLKDEKKITPETAIDNLERLRYAWRGDELEAQINYWLGRAYFDKGEYSKGLTIMQEAASLAEGTDLGRRVISEIAEEFANLFLGPKIEEITPLDAAALYEQFATLLPKGPQGDKVVERLAERLVQGDLLGRAGDLLIGQLNSRLQGEEAYNIATKLAAIYLLDGEPAKAMKIIDQAAAKLETLPDEAKTPARYREISLLRARALSRQGRPDQALALLSDVEKMPDTNRLRADIAWNAGYWDDAAEALDDVIIDQSMSLTRPLDEANATLLLHRAVALNLAADRIALANMREKYSDAMAQTDKARIFEVITRPRQSATLADRETLKGIVSEVDLFSDFLKSYKSVQAPPSN